MITNGTNNNYNLARETNDKHIEFGTHLQPLLTEITYQIPGIINTDITTDLLNIVCSLELPTFRC